MINGEIAKAPKCDCPYLNQTMFNEPWRDVCGNEIEVVITPVEQSPVPPPPTPALSRGRTHRRRSCHESLSGGGVGYEMTTLNSSRYRGE